MFETEIAEYEKVRQEYNQLVVEKFNPADFNEYNEILFSAHNCAIEGNSFSVDDTRALKEHGLSTLLYNKSLLEAFEMLDHFKAYEYLMSQTDQPLSEELLKATHAILTQHTLPYRHAGAVPGTYTDTDMGAGDTLFGDHEKNIQLIPRLLESTQQAIERQTVHPIEISASFHKYFIYLHPFRDGNGRMGRLFSNFILRQFNHPLLIVESQYKNSYIDALKTSHKHKNNLPIVAFFFQTAIGRMQKEIAEKKNLFTNFEIGIQGL